jgi:integrase-like protein
MEKPGVVAVRGHPQVVILPLAGISPTRCLDTLPTFATRLVRAGVDNLSIQHLLGHSKTTMTPRYAHSLADVKMASVRNLDFAGSCSSPDPNRTSGPQILESETGAKPLQSSTKGP